jgi:hypothetical protein
VEWKKIIGLLEQSLQDDIQYGSPEFNTIIHKLAVYSDKSVHDMYAWEYSVSPNEAYHYDYDKELALMERKDTQPDKARKKGILNKWQTLIKL